MSTKKKHGEIDWKDKYGYAAKIMPSLPLPYVRQNEKNIHLENGSMSMDISSSPKRELPYGLVPRILELYVSFVLKTKPECWDEETRTLTLGEHLRWFLKQVDYPLTSAHRAALSEQIKNWLGVHYYTEGVASSGSGFVMESYGVATRACIHGVYNDEETNGQFLTGWIQFSENYVAVMDRMTMNPVSLESVAHLKSSPLALDIYLWLTRKMLHLRRPAKISWDQLRMQFNPGRLSEKFNRNFKTALDRVRSEYPHLKLQVDDDGLILYPSPTSINRK